MPAEKLVLHDFPNQHPDLPPLTRYQAAQKVTSALQYLARKAERLPLPSRYSLADIDAVCILGRAEKQLHDEIQLREIGPKNPEQAATMVYAAFRYLLDNLTGFAHQEMQDRVDAAMILARVHDEVLISAGLNPVYTGECIDSLVKMVARRVQ